MRRTLSTALLAAALVTTLPGFAQTTQSPMPGMQMPSPSPTNMSMDMSNPPTTLIETELAHTTSGTSIEPASTPTPMLMRNDRGWTLMLHGNAFIADTQQEADNHRGADK